jgi:hypothetical protein
MLLSTQNIFVQTYSFMLIGFGFLIVYLRFHRWMSLGLTLFVISMAMQIYMLFGGFWYKWFKGGWDQGLTITLDQIIAA